MFAKNKPKESTFRRARFSLLNKHPAGCPFTANFGEDFTPYTLGSRASGACRFAALAAWLRHERNHGCGATFSFAVNRFCLDGGGAYAPDEIGEKSICIRGVVGEEFLPDHTQFFPAGEGKQSDARNTGWQSRVISDECMICRRLALFHRSHIVRSFASRRLYLRRSVFCLRLFAFAFMPWPCCERSEPASAAGAARVWGADSSPGFAATELQRQFLAAGENLALKKRCFSLRSSSAVIKIPVYGLFLPDTGLVTKWIYRKRKVVIK